MVLSTHVACSSRKTRFIKGQEASRVLSSLGVRTLLNQVSLVGSPLFQMYKMNEIIRKLLFAGGKFMPEVHLTQSGFTYNASKPFNKSKKKKKKKSKFQRNKINH